MANAPPWAGQSRTMPDKCPGVGGAGKACVRWELTEPLGLML